MPGLVINTNVPSINGQRHLFRSTGSLTKALERLSSGLRINRAGDDAAGLAISENLRSQVRGLNMAARNAGDGISLIQTAEGAINTYTEIIQRMRELSIQSASDVNSAQNRAAIQLEVDAQLEELQRIATTLNFNGLKLFDGSFTTKKIQVGADYNQFLDIDVGDLRTNQIGAVAQVTGAVVNTTALGAGDVLINGYPIQAAVDDGVSTASPLASAIAKATAINADLSNHGVTATVQAAVATGGAIGGGTLSVGNSLTINNVTFESGTFMAGDADGALTRAINLKSNITGVVATMSGGALVLTAADGRNITTSSVGTATASTGIAAALTTVGGQIKLTADNAYIVSDGTGDALTLIGFEGTQAVDNTTAINTIDVTTFDDAQDSILKIDNALRQINEIRAELGALTNRLEFTIQNLMISAENLSASDSRIRDADFAAETAALTRAQILQQSGVAVLAQANLTPQAALSLLQG